MDCDNSPQVPRTSICIARHHRGAPSTAVGQRQLRNSAARNGYASAIASGSAASTDNRANAEIGRYSRIINTSSAHVAIARRDDRMLDRKDVAPSDTITDIISSVTKYRRIGHRIVEKKSQILPGIGSQ